MRLMKYGDFIEDTYTSLGDLEENFGLLQDQFNESIKLMQPLGELPPLKTNIRIGWYMEWGNGV